MGTEIRTYAELQKQMHDALRIQHPEWVGPNGESPICDAYEARLAELLGLRATRQDRGVAPSPATGPRSGPDAGITSERAGFAGKAKRVRSSN